MIIGFTGHRDRVCEESDLLAIEEQYPGAVWVHGGAIGFDSQVNRVAIALGKRELAGTIVIKRPDYKRFGRYRAPLERNKEIVDMAEIIFACYDGRESGGTVQTMGYAESVGKTVVVLDPIREEKMQVTSMFVKTDDGQEVIKPIGPGVKLRDGYTEDEYETLMELISTLPASFFNLTGNAFENVAIEIVQIIERNKLDNLRNATNVVLETADRSKWKGQAINWAALSCYGTEFYVTDDGVSAYRSFVSEASAEAWEFALWVHTELAKRGFPDVEVILEW